MTNLASTALKAKVPECARDSGKTCNENVTNQGGMTGEAANQHRLRLDESQSYQGSLLLRTQRGGGGPGNRNVSAMWCESEGGWLGREK